VVVVVVAVTGFDVGAVVVVVTGLDVDVTGVVACLEHAASRRPATTRQTIRNKIGFFIAFSFITVFIHFTITVFYILCTSIWPELKFFYRY